MIDKKWVQFNYPGPQPLSFRTLCDGGDSLEGLVSYFDGDFWVRQQVAIPVRVGRCARVGGDHEQVVAITICPPQLDSEELASSISVRPSWRETMTKDVFSDL
jgi:hypothetical protein